MLEKLRGPHPKSEVPAGRKQADITAAMLEAGRFAMSAMGFPRDWETYDPSEIDAALRNVFQAMKAASSDSADDR